MTGGVLLESAYIWKNLSDIVSYTSDDLDVVTSQMPAGNCFAVNESKLRIMLGENMVVQMALNDVNDTVPSISVINPYRTT